MGLSEQFASLLKTHHVRVTAYMSFPSPSLESVGFDIPTAVWDRRKCFLGSLLAAQHIGKENLLLMGLEPGLVR